MLGTQFVLPHGLTALCNVATGMTGEVDCFRRQASDESGAEGKEALAHTMSVSVSGIDQKHDCQSFLLKWATGTKVTYQPTKH